MTPGQFFFFLPGVRYGAILRSFIVRPLKAAFYWSVFGLGDVFLWGGRQLLAGVMCMVGYIKPSAGGGGVSLISYPGRWVVSLISLSGEWGVTKKTCCPPPEDNFWNSP